jgi:hypothetical protein
LGVLLAAYRDKKVVGVFVRFRAPLNLFMIVYCFEKALTSLLYFYYFEFLAAQLVQFY